MAGTGIMSDIIRHHVVPGDSSRDDMVRVISGDTDNRLGKAQKVLTSDANHGYTNRHRNGFCKSQKQFPYSVLVIDETIK